MNIKQKSTKGKPEWVSSFVDQDRYKLSQAELMQKKISLMSKHRIEAKDQWQQVQEKLKNNVVDDETQKIYLTALNSKGLNNSTSKRKNLTQMIEWEREKSDRTFSQSQTKPDVLEQAKMLLLESDRNQSIQESNIIDKIKTDLQETKQFVAKAQKLKKPEKILKAQQEKQQEKNKQESKTINSQKQIKSAKKEEKKEQIQTTSDNNYGFNGLKNLDNVISFLENTLHSQEVQISHLKEENPFKNAVLTDAKTINSEVPIFSNNNTQEQFYQKEKQDQQPKQQENFEQNKENYLYTNFTQTQKYQELPKQNDIPKYEQFKQEILKIEESQPPQNVQQKLNFDKITLITKNELSFDDNIDQLKLLLEQTRQELNQMNLQDSSITECVSFQKETKNQSNMLDYFQPKQIDYQMIHRKYKNYDTFDINDHLI